jgi:hypothetical protein
VAGVGERTEPDPDAQAPRQEDRLEDQSPPRAVARLLGGHGRHRDHAQHGDEDRDRQQRPDLAETAGDVVDGHDHDVAGDVSSEQPPERQKADDVHRAGRRAQDDRQQPAGAQGFERRCHRTRFPYTRLGYSGL